MPNKLIIISCREIGSFYLLKFQPLYRQELVVCGNINYGLAIIRIFVRFIICR